MEFVEYSLESLHDESVRLAKAVERDGYRPDCVAYLARGGWIIGKTVAEYFAAPLIELSAHRSGDVAKSHGALFLARLPRRVRKMLREWEIEKRLSNDSGRTQRKSIRLSDRYEAPTNAKRILLVDDSADTGASLAVAQELLVCLYPNSEIRIAVINAFSRAQESLRIDWLLHSSRLLCLPSSKDHSEYSKFMDLYELDDSK